MARRKRRGRVEATPGKLERAGGEVAEILPALAIECHYLAVQDCLLHGQLLPHPIAEFLKSLEDVPALGPEMTVLPGHVEQPAIAVVLGLEEPGGIIEWIAPRSK